MLNFFFIPRDVKCPLLPSSADAHDHHAFADLAGSEVKFDKHGDGLARYEILNFRKETNNNGTNGYQYQVKH